MAAYLIAEHITLARYSSNLAASVMAWYKSSEYQTLIALRKACTSGLDMLFTPRRLAFVPGHCATQR